MSKRRKTASDILEGMGYEDVEQREGFLLDYIESMGPDGVDLFDKFAAKQKRKDKRAEAKERDYAEKRDRDHPNGPRTYAYFVEGAAYWDRPEHRYPDSYGIIDEATYRAMLAYDGPWSGFSVPKGSPLILTVGCDEGYLRRALKDFEGRDTPEGLVKWVWDAERQAYFVEKEGK